MVALKIINIDKLEDSFRKTKKTSREELLNAVQTEAKILQTLTHPNIVAFVASFSFSSCEYLAMELVEGVTLRNLIPFSKGILEQRARDLFQQIGEAVRYCHSMQVCFPPFVPSFLLPFSFSFLFDPYLSFPPTPLLRLSMGISNQAISSSRIVQKSNSQILVFLIFILLQNISPFWGELFYILPLKMQR